MKKTIFILFSLLMSSLALADKQCDQKGIQFIALAKTSQFSIPSLVLASGKTVSVPQLYLFHNKTKQGFWINHPADGGGMQAGWASEIKPGAWSALLVNKPNFAMSCTQLTATGVKNLVCKKVVSVCRYAKPNLPKSGYWIAENVTLEKAKQKINHLHNRSGDTP